ncbi:hypothetical protein QZH41_005637 [Actinostola sp. cb2023]|nr:hypothetical protein QZH41_005637 [Actinostola sp. cb2023]
MTSTTDYENLCRLDVLGLQDFPEGDQNQVYTEFKEQLVRSPEGWYETGLPWKGNHPPLHNNEAGSLRRLHSLERKLEKQGLTEKYHNIIQEQLEAGIVERVTDPPNGREFYIPHKAVVREAAESTKLRVVYDASARAYDNATSLNECLNPGPPLQNQLWNVLVRARFHPVAITGDIKQAFLQVRIREEDRDALRFHWLKDLDTKTVETLRFTRALFGLAPSPFLLGGVLKHHLEMCKSLYPEIVGEIERSLYVDDLISGGPAVEHALQVKSTATEIFAKGGFELHKWHSSARELETTELPSNGDIETFAKEQLGVPKGGESTLLGLTWDKGTDTICVKFPAEPANQTKRGILGKVARIYDPLGLTSPVTLGGKLLYRDACDVKLAWDAELPTEVSSKWSKWEESLPDKITVPRSIATHQEEIEEVELHAFGDASGKGVCAAVYAVIKQPTGVNQGLVAAKARLAKRGLTIPRLELVSGHMAVNLLTNVSAALDGFSMSSRHGWLDSSVALHWIRGQGQYKQFVSNRVQKIQDHPEITWHHVSTKDNPADVGSRSGKVSEHTLWWKGPPWLTDKKLWPPDITTTATAESQTEAKALREVFAVAVAEPDALDALLQRSDYWRAMRVCGWVMRFIQNARATKAHRVRGPLTTREIETARLVWVKRAQASASGSDQFEEDKLQLNLQPNSEGVLECRGRIQGEYPVFLPDNQLYTQKVVMDAHLTTLHGGMGLTMAKVRQQHWVPRLRRLTKRIVKSCHGCRRFQAQAYATPPPGNLPTDRTEGETPFQVIGVDYAGPIKYRGRGKTEGKAYVVLYACSLSRGLFLELLPNMETTEFLGSLKRLIARRGRPKKIYSDNGRTFIGAAKWIKQVMRDERVQDFLAQQQIHWQFNLSRAPWWGGQFERMVGLVKAALYKTIGNGMLSWKELQEVILDVEVTLNNRPLSYVEDDIQLPILTPNSLLYIQHNMLPDLQTHHVQDYDLRNRAKHLLKCKNALWSRWTTEYLRSLREQHRLKHKGANNHPNEDIRNRKTKYIN